MTSEEFEQGYAERTHRSIEELRKIRTVRPCDCGEEMCQGWQSVSHLEAAIFDAAEKAGIHPMDWETSFFEANGRLPELQDFE